MSDAKTIDVMVVKAIKFATDKHKGQVRKYTGEPYIKHCLAVQESVSKMMCIPRVLAAAVLHDTIEDTEATPVDLFRNFGNAVTEIVLELTDKYTSENYPMLNRKERKFLEACRLREISDEAKLIKYFDIMDNSSSIFKHDPGFSRVYLKEKQFILGYSLADIVF